MSELDPRALLHRMLESEPNNPRLRLVAQLMAAQQSAGQNVEQPEEPRPKLRATELKETLRAVGEELRALRSLNDDLAAALGACRLCWGADPDCPRCDGRGGAGWIQPDPDKYRMFVEPAIRRTSSKGDE
jgi:hypothetical protein